MSDLFLTQDEVRELPAQIRHALQRKELNFMGTEHRVRSDGTLLVLRAHVEETLGPTKRRSPTLLIEPNWDAC